MIRQLIYHCENCIAQSNVVAHYDIGDDCDTRALPTPSLAFEIMLK